MFISSEGLVSGSVNRAELVAAYNEATDEAVRANLAAVGAENGMEVVDGKLIDPSAESESDLSAVIAADTEGAVKAIKDLGVTEPPRSGPGSGRDAWVAYSGTLGIEVTDDMTRDDIIAAVDEENA